MNTKLQLTFRFLFLISCLLSMQSIAQNVTVSGAVSGNGSYATLEAAFTAINGGAQTGATITVAITGNTIETSTATLNANSWASLTILPSGGAARSISGNLSAAIVNFSGAANVVIDGLNVGGNLLSIENTNTGIASTISFNNDCSNILVQNCTVLGANTDAGSGTLLFGGAVSSGNNNIRVKSCTIDASTAGFPVNGIYASKAVNSGKENSNDSIINSSVSNFFNAALASSGIALDSGNTNWNISGCRLFQSASRTYSTGNTHSAIRITSGNAHTISGNTIGFANVAGTGTYTMTGTAATRFIGIDLSAGTTTASSIQGNIISAISLNTSNGASTGYGALCGIRANAGNINIGDVSPNIIGGSTGVDLITLSSTTTQATIVGINSASTGTISIKSNIIGGLTSSSATPAIAGGVFGICVSAVANSITISGNTIGNSSANNIRAGILGTTTGSSIVNGVLFSTAPNASDVSNNTVQNLASYGTSSGYIRGIATYASSGVTSPFTIKGNIISKLTSNGTLGGATSAMTAAAGITLSVGENNVISENKISDISLIGTTTSTCYAAGITMGNSTTTTISGNKIHTITNAGTSTTLASPTAAVGILIRSGNSDLNIFNNMISLGTGSTNNTVFIGIMGNHGSTPNPIDYIYHNTVNIAGTASSGAMPSFCFLRGDLSTTGRTATVTLKNNIFTNSRSGGTGYHFAIANNYGVATSPPTGWATNASDNNILNANISTIGYWSGNKTFADWKTASASDANSYSGETVTYIDPVSDLHLNMGTTPTVIESGGQTIAGVTVDIDGQVRPGPAGSANGGAFAPDLGADEIDGVFKDALPPVITYTALTSTCDTTSRSLTAAISDISSVPFPGLLQPRIYYRKNKDPWVSTPGTLTTGTASNGTWNFPVLTTSLFGGLKGGDTVSYFVIAQDMAGNIISNPAAGLVATDVNTITSYPATPNYFAVYISPSIVSTTPGAVCDSGKVTLGATASAGTLNWYTASSGGISQGTGTSFITPQLKTTTPFYVDATNNGCTSARTAVVATVNHSANGDLIKTACDSLVWNGKTYKTSGVYYDTISTTKGCDSIVKLTLTIPHSSISVENIIACDAYKWNGTTYTASGTYLDTIPNKAGCDSLMTLHLTINLSPTKSVIAKACDSLSWRGKTYYYSGMYKDTVHNASGCDSIFILTLTMHYTTSSTKTVKTCGTYIWNGIPYTKTGVYKDTIQNMGGCDSIMILDLTVTHVNATVSVNNNVITADSVADSYQWVDCLKNYSLIAGETNKTYTSAYSGSFAVIEVKNGCIDTSSCIPVIVTGIATSVNDQMYFYPNPGKGVYNLVLPEDTEVKIINPAGEIVFYKKLNKGTHLIDLHEPANGIYMMHLFNEHQYKVYKLIKQE